MNNAFLVSSFLFLVGCACAQDARQIVAESQKRTQSKSQRYEGTLEVVRLRKLAPAYPVLVNGQPASQKVLADQDRVTVGSVDVRPGLE